MLWEGVQKAISTLKDIQSQINPLMVGNCCDDVSTIMCANKQMEKQGAQILSRLF